MSYLLRLFKTFIVLAVSVGLLTCTFMVVFGGSIDKGINYGAKSGLFFATFLVVFSIYSDIIFRQWVFVKLKVRSFDLSQYREIHLKGELKCIFAQVLAVLKMIPTIKKISPDAVGRKISATTGSSILTFGELIDIEFFLEADNVRITISSRPRLMTTMVDYGKNIENVEIISALLRDEKEGKQIIQKVTMPSFFIATVMLSPFAIIAIVFIIINN